MSKNPLLDKSYCFHSIGGDIFRIESILKHGILSQSSLSTTGMPENSVDGMGYNGLNKVSVFISPLFCESNQLGGYADGIVFVCQTHYSVHNVRSGIPDEAHVFLGVPRDKIKGIMLPDSFWRAPINEYNKFMCGYDRLPKVCNSFTKWMKKECDYEANDYKKMLLKIKREKDPLKSEDLVEELGNLVFGDVQQAVDKKLGKHNATFADLVKYYTKDTNLILYRTEELENDETYLKRLKTKKIKSATQNVRHIEGSAGLMATLNKEKKEKIAKKLRKAGNHTEIDLSELMKGLHL